MVLFLCRAMSREMDLWLSSSASVSPWLPVHARRACGAPSGSQALPTALPPLGWVVGTPSPGPSWGQHLASFTLASPPVGGWCVGVIGTPLLWGTGF